MRPPLPAFLIAPVDSPTLVPNVAGTYNFTLTPLNGFNGAVSLSCVSPPAGVTNCTQSGPLSLSITAVAGMNHVVTVRGQSGALTASTSISVVTPQLTGPQSAVFDGTRSLTFGGFDNKAHLNNLTAWRLETRIHGFTTGTILDIGKYKITADSNSLWFYDYNPDSGPVGYACNLNRNPWMNDLTIRIERRADGYRYFQVWDQQHSSLSVGNCFDSNTQSSQQAPRTLPDRLWPATPTTPGRLGGNAANGDKLNGKVAWFRIYGAAVANNLPPSDAQIAPNLLYGLEFDGALTDQFPAGQASIPPDTQGSAPTYQLTPAPPSPTYIRSAVFDGTRSLTFESFDNKAYLNNLSSWRLEARVHDLAPLSSGGTLLSIGNYNVSVSPTTIYFLDYNADGGRAVPFACYLDRAGRPTDLTIRIERRSDGTRSIQFWDAQQNYIPADFCWDSSSGNPVVQNPRTSLDRLWPTSPGTPGRLGADTYNNDKFSGKVAYLRIYGAAANNNTAPPLEPSTTDLLFSAEFEGTLDDSGPNNLAITNAGTPIVFYTERL